MQYTLSPDPVQWGTTILPGDKEDDDDLHHPETLVNGKLVDANAKPTTWRDVSWRGVINLGSLVIVIAAVLTLL